MALNITRGIIHHAQKVVIYGVEGVGKSTFASQFPDPLFIDVEGSTKHLDVARVETPKSWTALMGQIQKIKDTRPCQTLVIDTADWAERMCIEHVCSTNGKKSIEGWDYGKGYVFLAEEYARMLDRLTDVTDAGVNVVLTAHAEIRKFEQPDEVGTYDRWELKLSKSGQKKISPIVKEWADALLFANYKSIIEYVDAGMGKEKAKATGGQKRVMYCNHAACWDAKNRWGLPDEVPFEYAQIAPFIPAGQHKPQPSAAQQSNPYGNGMGNNHGKQPDAKVAAIGNGLPDFWGPALQLMEPDGITPDEVVAMCARKGWFTEETPPERLPEDFINQCLIGQWNACRDDILFNRPVPFEID